MSAVLLLRVVNGTHSRPVTSIVLILPASLSIYFDNANWPVTSSFQVISSIPGIVRSASTVLVWWKHGLKSGYANSLVCQVWPVPACSVKQWKSPIKQYQPAKPTLSPPSSSTEKAITAVGLAPSWGYLQLYECQTIWNEQIKNISSSMCLFSKLLRWNHQIIIKLNLAIIIKIKLNY